ncbi:MAG: SagB/ThcOx family dehydrogenase [Thermodesulfobacteriota bacterium]
MPDLAKSLGVRFLAATNLSRRGSGERLAIAPVPAVKTCPGSRRLALPAPQPPPADLWQILAHRRSRRRYGTRPVTLSELAILLWASQGLTDPSRRPELRAAPSAGALHPIETYCLCHRVEDVAPAIAHLDVAAFALEILAEGPVREPLLSALLGQTMAMGAAVTVVWSARLRRTMAKYGDRGLRYIWLDAGHLAQNLLLAAEALGLAACPVGAFCDDELNQLLGLDGQEETVLYLVTVGPPA